MGRVYGWAILASNSKWAPDFPYLPKERFEETIRKHFDDFQIANQGGIVQA